MHLRLPHARKDRQQQADNADHETAEECIPEPAHVEAQIQQPRHPSGHQQHQRVDDEDEQAERENDDGQRQQFQQRPDARVQHTENDCNKQQRPPAAMVFDAVDELNCHPERRGVDQQPDKEEHQVEYYRHVIARFFHAWERRLHAVSKDRVVRPFEWGLDWINLNGHPRDSSPEQVLLDWASHAVADSTRFFETPDTTDYTFRANVDGATGALSFPSALHTRYAENNTVHALYFRSNGRPRRTQTRRAKRAVLVLPQWNAGPDGHVGLCRLLNKFDLSALRLTLPYHDARRPAELHRADYIVSANIGRTVQACRQAVMDARR